MNGFLYLIGLLHVLWIVPQFYTKKQPLYTWELYKTGQLGWTGDQCRAPVKMVVGVMSAMENFAQRSHVRRTWARHAQRLGIQVVFMLGSPEYIQPASQLTVSKEASFHRDMVFGKFLDTYRNLTLKVLSLMEWTITYCPHSRWLFKTDDDVFLFLVNIIAFMKENEKEESAIWGFLKSGSPAREKYRPNYVSYLQYPYSIYPVYATGAAYVIPMSFVRRIFKTSLTSVYLPVEDVFLTGVVAMSLDLPRRNKHAFKFGYKKFLSNPQEFEKTILAIHTGSNSKSMWRIWHLIFNEQLRAPTVDDALKANDSDYFL